MRNKLTAWPNKLGFDFKTSQGDWEIMTATPGKAMARLFTSPSEPFPYKYGEGKDMVEAIRNAVVCEI